MLPHSPIQQSPVEGQGFNNQPLFKTTSSHTWTLTYVACKRQPFPLGSVSGCNKQSIHRGLNRHQGAGDSPPAVTGGAPCIKAYEGGRGRTAA
jgi:hypothetical protein